MTLKRLGLIGYPLTHSFSKNYFTQKFEREGIPDFNYELYPLENIAAFPELIQKTEDLQGLNVTIPYKQSVIPFLDEIDEEAREVGAVNCIKIEKGKLKGYNTDVYGFEHALSPFIGKDKKEIKALVLGNGGAAKAVTFVLKKLHIPALIVERRTSAGSLTYEDLTSEIIHTNRLIIQTTPLGMTPDVRSSPLIPYAALTPRHFLYDLVYNPEETVFLKKGKNCGAQVQNGLSMLHLQAERAWKIWNRPLEK